MKTVLLVSDDPISSRVHSKLLILIGGFAVTQTRDLEQVMPIAQSGEVDIIFITLGVDSKSWRDNWYGKEVEQVQILDGITITRRLKANAQTAHIPVIVFPGSFLENDVPLFQEHCGADDYFYGYGGSGAAHEEFVGRFRVLLSDNEVD